MTTDEIRELIRVVQETGIAELEVQRGDSRVWIRAALSGLAEPVVTPAISSTSSSQTAGAPAGQIKESNVHELTVATDDERNEVIKSPIVGTYYDSPAPGSGPFIRVGDRVEPKQVLCIIESMKLMNEIESDIAGTVLAKHVENGRPVEYGEALFTIRPL